MRTPFAAAMVVLVCALGAQAQARTPAEEAKEHYERGVVAYNLERFDEAIAAFTKAYELDPAPTLLFNIAQSRWKKGENERALFYYRRYLEADPNAANRPTVEARIRELEAARRAPAPVAASAPAPVAAPAPRVPPVFVQAAPPPPERPPLYRRPWVWGVVAAAVAGTVATVLLLSSNEKPPGCTNCKLGEIVVSGP
jgi:tetratricopeptide (TPR) repeat protein